MNFRKARNSQEALTVLGLDSNNKPSILEIKKAYKALAFQCHPDRNPDDPNALQKFMEISYAYEMLTNPQFRLKEERTSDTSILNVSINVSIKFEDGFFGRRFRIYPTMLPPEYSNPQDNSDPILDLKQQIEPVVVDIPPGSVRKEFIFKQKGLTDSRGNRGDFLVTVDTLPHPIFHMDGVGNVIINVSLPLRLMLKGGTTDVQTMFGIKQLKVPPGTQPKDQIKMPRFGPTKEGAQVVVVTPEYPSKDELKNHQDWQLINIDWDTPIRAEDDELNELLSTFNSNLENK